MSSTLKLLDELLLEYMRSHDLKPKDLAGHSEATREALARLRCAWIHGEMEEITLTWANYFRETSNG